MQQDEQAIRDLVAAWMKATESGDLLGVLGLMADDVVFLVPGQPPMNKTTFARGQGNLSQFRLHVLSDIKEVRVTTDWAYCWSSLQVTMTPRAGGASITRAGQVLSILQKQKGRWVIVRDANMLAVVKPK